MRSDAQANRDRLLRTAAEVITSEGVDASMRDIARRSGVGLATLLRHFPSREALLDALLRTRFDEMTARAEEVEAAARPDDALVLWLRDFLELTASTRGVISAMVQAIEDEESALHASCTTMRGAGARLLKAAQEGGLARPDIDGADLFALASALAWLGDQPGQQERAGRLFELMVSAVLTPRAASTAEATPVVG